MAVKIKAIVRKVGRQHPGDDTHLEYGHGCRKVVRTSESSLGEGIPAEDLRGDYFYIEAVPMDVPDCGSTASEFYEGLTQNVPEGSFWKRRKDRRIEGPYYSRGGFAIVDSKIEQISLGDMIIPPGVIDMEVA